MTIIIELMSNSNVQQPTDDITGAWPLLWRFDIRPRAEWYYLQSPSAPASYRQPVAVAPEVRDAPKPSVVVTESAVSVTIVSPASGTSFAPAPDASESPVIDDTVQIPVSVPALPEGEESTSTPEIPAVDCLPPNPFTGFVPVPKRVIELGHGHPPRYEMWRIGNALSCEICGVSGSRKELELHRQSEGHVFERERQRLWTVKCVICKVMCDGLKCYEDHRAGKKHRRLAEKIDLSQVEGFCHGYFCEHLECIM